MIKQNHVVYFDGVCNLCNGFVQFLLKNDKRRRLSFAALQSEVGKSMLAKFNKSETEYDSVVFVVDGKPIQKSSAALHVFKTIGGLWSLAYGFIILPVFLRDWVYDVIAKNRYRWFGKREACMVPSPEIQARFLD